jgi:hypothetical protein
MLGQVRSSMPHHTPAVATKAVSAAISLPQFRPAGTTPTVTL